MVVAEVEVEIGVGSFGVGLEVECLGLLIVMLWL